MKITIDYLAAHDAPDYVKEFFTSKYPEGATLEEIAKRTVRDYDPLFWCYYYCTELLTIDDRVAFDLATHIHDCAGTYWSYDCSDSTAVSFSSNINNSQYIDKSHMVFTSEFISNSSQITCCSGIVDSVNVTSSAHVGLGVNIDHSEFIKNSDIIDNSFFIVGSKEISNSRFCRDCERMEDAMFCAQSADLKHALFCTIGCEGEYLIFNQKVSPDTFERTRRQYQSFFERNINKIAEGVCDVESGENLLSQNITKVMPIIGEEMAEWIRTLPGYNNFIAFSIFHNPCFLKEAIS